MRFQDHLLLQKQHAEELERQVVAQQILDEASTLIQPIYNSRRRFRDPIEESKARIKTLQRRAASASATTSLQSSITPEARQQQVFQRPNQPDSVQKELTVRHLNDHANLNPTAFKIYRKLRFGS